MIDVCTSLALSLHDNPGGYALLLGSDISSAAKIMTGWQIQLHLLNRLSVALGCGEQDQPNEWALKRFQEDLNYSTILKKMGESRAERQKLIEKYFEPEPGDAPKAPTTAHKVIAELMKAGLVRVIITTNFDRLQEKALQAVGIEPTVVDTPAAAAGKPILRECRCLVLKLHGDYKSERMLNTEEELSNYSPAMKRFLSRILEEHGLIVCGWSATYDHALQRELEKSTNKRFPTFWLTRGGTLSPEGERLAKLWGARLANANDADTFFIGLHEKVRALASFKANHPMQPAIAVESVKDYLLEPRLQIKFNDLVDSEATACTINGRLNPGA